jgi:bifunctional aspartokinase / homoserine dehydrogenase 1
MKVLKFGGTSVGSIEALRMLLEIVDKSRLSGEQPTLVCSAMSGVTNSLTQMADKATLGESYQDDLDALATKHIAVIKHFLNESDASINAVRKMIWELSTILQGVKALGELSLRTLDRIMAYGEQLSCSIVAFILREKTGFGMYTDARQLIITDSSFGNAVVSDNISRTNIINWHKKLGNEIPVITGFISATEKGDTTTLGRGGSDYTAALIGAALDAQEIQIWTDVNGFMTADPRLVKNAFTLSRLSYKEAMELSYFGAKVIYPPSLIPAIMRNIPILIKNTFNSEHAGTYILPEAFPNDNGTLIKGISSISQVSLVNVEGSGMVGLKGFGGRLFRALADTGINIILITQASSEHSISFAIKPADTQAALNAINNEFALELLANIIEQPKAFTQLSILAVVGENMRHTKGLSGKLFQSLGRSGVNVVAIAQGSSELNISVVIAADDLAKALNSVHDSLFLSPVKTLHLFCAGTGNIGSEMFSQLHKSQQQLVDNHQLHFKVMGIINSRKMIVSSNDGIYLANWNEELFLNGEKSDADKFIGEIEKLNLPGSIFVDNTSNQDLAMKYGRLFSQNVSVVACNKHAASGPYQYYQQLKSLARKNGVDFFYETNVGAGLPIIKTMNDLLISGDRIVKTEAILSGTISYIFNNYSCSRTFAEVVREAQQNGFTEPDPRDDLNGMDFSRKMLILARETGLALEIQDVKIDSILPQNCIEADSTEAFYQELEKSEPFFESLKNKALQEKKLLRYIGTIADGQIQIRLSLVDISHPFYGLTGSDNIISFTTLRYKNNPLVVKGPGAGAGVTAAGVFADILRVAAP